MSAAAVPTPNSSSVARRAPRLTERARALLTALNLHFAGVAALGAVVLYLAIHLFVVYQGLQANNADALATERVQLAAAQIAARPLRGLDKKVELSTEQADDFYAHRLPYAYSQVAAELGVLTHRTGVRLARVQYAQTPALSGKDELTEVRMDASVSGDYRSVMQFVNALERDRMFFLISGINLSGQQTGQVNLRIRLTTFLRTANVEESKREFALPAGADAKASAKLGDAGGAQ